MTTLRLAAVAGHFGRDLERGLTKVLGIVDDARQQGHRAAPAGGYVEAGVGETRLIARGTGTTRPSAAHNPHVGSDIPQARGTGGQYQ